MDTDRERDKSHVEAVAFLVFLFDLCRSVLICGSIFEGSGRRFSWGVVPWCLLQCEFMKDGLYYRGNVFGDFFQNPPTFSEQCGNKQWNNRSTSGSI